MNLDYLGEARGPQTPQIPRNARGIPLTERAVAASIDQQRDNYERSRKLQFGLNGCSSLRYVLLSDA